MPTSPGSPAPILLFTYNRPKHTRQTLECLKNCRLAEQSELFVFCDAAKPGASDTALENVSKVRELVESIDFFRKVTVCFRDTNYGLFRNVTEGVTSVINTAGRVIVLEDDLLIGEYFLEYMNDALNKYENKQQVQQISGFVFPFGLRKSNTAFFMPNTNTIGWATWNDRWQAIDFSPSDTAKLKRNKTLRSAFDLDSTYPYANMLHRQVKNEKTGSWAILYWWHTFKTAGLVLYPDHPLVQHNDHDQSGVHGGDTSYYDEENWDSHYSIDHFPDELEVSSTAYDALKDYLRGSMLDRVKYRIKNFGTRISAVQ